MKILIIDIETTGFLNTGGKIVEIGIVELDLSNGQKQILFDSLCHESGITKDECDRSWVVKNTSITTEMIRHSPNLNKIKTQIQDIINNYPDGATAFNNSFDFGFLENRGFNFPKKLNDPMLISTDILKLPPKMIGTTYKWPKAQEAYDYFFPNSGYVEIHRGADDAIHEADIVYKLHQLNLFL